MRLKYIILNLHSNMVLLIFTNALLVISGVTFTFQYGSTYIVTRFKDEIYNYVIYIPIWFYLYYEKYI